MMGRIGTSMSIFDDMGQLFDTAWDQTLVLERVELQHATISEIQVVQYSDMSLLAAVLMKAAQSVGERLRAMSVC